MSNHGKVSQHTILIIGAGAGGIACASSLLARDATLDIAIIEPADKHYYQPGWTMVGAGVFDQAATCRQMADYIPKSVKWIQGSVASFQPDADKITLEDGSRFGYKVLIAAPGLKLNWDGVEGLQETLGKNGVTSNYRYDLAPYTWQLVQGLKAGKAIFTQPPMPIKCAGAPQKAMYLSGDHWFRNGHMDSVNIEFHNAGGVLFGVKEYVPALMEYVKKYKINLAFMSRLVKIDGPAHKAWFEVSKDGDKTIVERDFDMIHVCPPQLAPDFVRTSPLADAAGWIEVKPDTMQHVRYANIFSLGDACSTPNAKTAAAARKQAPVVANNVMSLMAGKPLTAAYDGYGSCPLTVERGKIVLAEFLYGGKVAPTFPTWLNDGTKPTSLAWLLKARLLPLIYWNAMLKGREWLAKPHIIGAQQTLKR